MKVVVFFLVSLFLTSPVLSNEVDGTGVICQGSEDEASRMYFFYGGRVHELYLGAYEIVKVIKLTKYSSSDLVISWSMPIRGTTWEYRRRLDIKTSVLLMENVDHAESGNGKDGGVKFSVSYDCEIMDLLGLEEKFGPGSLDSIVKDRGT